MMLIFRSSTGGSLPARLPPSAMVLDLGWAQNRAQFFAGETLAFLNISTAQFQGCLLHGLSYM